MDIRKYIARYIKNRKIKTKCEKGKHDWNYYTWGSAPVDNLDDTFCFWSIPVRNCETCKKHEMKLKDGYEAAKKGLTINDME